MKKLGKGNKKKYLVFLLFIAMAVSPLLAASNSDDYGINSALGVLKGIIYAIGGACIVVSLSLWALKGIIKKSIEPRDWTAIIVILGCGVLLLVAPTLAQAIVGDGLGGFEI